eukprot:Pgem_evm1s20095
MSSSASKFDNAVSGDQDYSISEADITVGKKDISTKRPPFKQGNRCCWGGMPLWGFVLLCIFISLCVLAAVLVPVIFLPVASNSVQHSVDNTNFEITYLHAENFDPTIFFGYLVPTLGNLTLYQSTNNTAYLSNFVSLVPFLNASSIQSRYLLVNATILMSNVDKLANGAEIQPTTAQLITNQFDIRNPATGAVMTSVPTQVFGDVTLPSATLSDPNTVINSVVTVEATGELGTQMDTPLPAMPTVGTADFVTWLTADFTNWVNYQTEMNGIAGCYALTQNTCSWLANGPTVVKKKLAATTMFYGANLKNKLISFN